MTRYLLGVDLGASALKATIISERGAIMGEASHAVPFLMPHPGWAEQNPQEWVAAFCNAVPAALQNARLPGSSISAIGLSAGTHSVVLCDDAGDVLRPAIMWADQRSAAEAKALNEDHGAAIIETALNKANPTWSLPMLTWVRTCEPEIFARISRVFFAKDYLRWWLTGIWATDYSDAVGSLLADDTTKNWSPALCALAGITPGQLPPIHGAAEVLGHVSAAAGIAAGLAAGTPVVCGANDTTVELFGAGAMHPGDGAIKLASAGVVYLVTNGPHVRPPVSTYPHLTSGLYYCASGTNSCASAHRWLRDVMFTGGYEAMDRLAAAVPLGAEGLLFHPYLQGERAPYWDPKLRADFVGLTMRHGQGHFARAVYEGIAFSLRDVITEAQALGLFFGRMRLLGGGAQSALWRQILADVTGLTLERVASGDASFGAAMLAGIGAGTFTSLEDAVTTCVEVREVTTPNAAAHARYSELFTIYKDAQNALATINHRLGDWTTQSSSF